ncbi:MAG: hypothetical protein IH899_03980 [Planctomycetes bacterium]|nr:hypothetical protein [Planctomycetota bacterium]
MDRTVCVVGLGRLGAPIAACIASKGFNVIGVDINPDIVDMANEGSAPVSEPGLDDLFAANRTRMRATLQLSQAVLDSDMIFILVPTPSDSSGRFSLQHVAVEKQNCGKAHFTPPSCCCGDANTFWREHKENRYALLQFMQGRLGASWATQNNSQV